MRRMLVFCLLILASTAAFGWIQNPSNRHYYTLTSSPKLYWDAQAEAEVLGGHLTVIRDAAEQSWLYNTFKPLMPDGLLWHQQNYWIGLYQLPGSVEPAGGWVWITGEPVTYTNWNPGEPNNGGLGKGEGCGIMQTDWGGTWNDGDNFDARKYGIVELPSPLPIPEPASLLALACGLGGLGMAWKARKVVLWLLCVLLLAVAGGVFAMPVQWSGNGHWYEAVLVPEGITWVDAKVAAEAMGGYLATATSAEENLFIFNLVKDDMRFWNPPQPDHTQGPWLGGIQKPGATNPVSDWEWVTGAPFVYTCWASGEPNDADAAGGNEDALQYLRWNYGDPTWNDFPREYAGTRYSNPFGYIVEWDTNPVPEPASVLVLVSGLGSLGIMVRRYRR